jgi:hypothetical protein
MARETAPNQGATGRWRAARRGGPPPPSAGPVNVGAPVNQGATAAGPEGAAAFEPGAAAFGESPLSAGTEDDAFAARPELYVGAAFVGGFALAQILKRLGR